MYGQFQMVYTDSASTGHRSPGQGDLLPRLLAVTFGAFLFASTFSIAAAQVSLAVSVLIYTAIQFRRRDFSGMGSLKALLLVWAAYFVWLVIASLINDNPWRSLNCIREEWLLIILPIGLYLNRNWKVTRRLMLALAVGVILMSIYGVIQHFLGWRFFTGQPLSNAGNNFRLTGNFSHPLTYGYFVVTSTIFFLTFVVSTFRSQDRLTKILLTTAASLGLLASALCNSRGPMLALLIGLVFVGLLAGRIRWAILSLGLLGVVVVMLSPGLVDVFATRFANDWRIDNPAGRLFIWKYSGAVAFDNPLFGCGPGNFREAFTTHLPPELAESGTKGHAHNDFIHQAAVAGFPAALLLLVFWGVACRHFWKLRRRLDLSPQQRALAFACLAASVAFLVGSMTECAYADEELRHLVMALWAFAWHPSDAT